ncbi:TetR/AcrR family transcriptional regulator C-terminal domain-containing protein [Streptosporangium sp. NPDC001559]|uniref:TetR/AcrR family transcriptional regulator C-terminal domain-containing protein n=1 Tax=Streptosporangium sp. NPDC001559 TaxID=3366187 RepID=UPI0036E486C5
MTQPPHARIAADVKRRIADGRLREGDRVPSTRQLARDWGVALATAAKALTLLAREGVVVAEPRVGTVVAKPRGGEASPRRPVAPGVDLTRERVVRAAIDIADAQGFSELTMRGVADRVGTATMSLYRHVGGKDDLVLLMIDAVVEEFPLPADPPYGWRARLETSARLQWAAYRAHPWLVKVTSLTRPVPSASLLKHTEWAFGALRDTPIDAVTKMHVHTLLYSFVQGIAVNIERERQALASTGLTQDEWMDGQEDRLRTIFEAGRYPNFGQVVDDLAGDFDLDLDHLFHFGLTALLDGLTGIVERG